MRQQLPQQPRREVPQVARPHTLGREPLAELRENRLNAVTDAGDGARPLAPPLKARLLVRNQHLQALAAQPLCQLRLPVGAVSETDAFGSVGQLFQQSHVREGSRAEAQAGDDSRPTDACVKAKAVEGLPDRVVKPEARMPAKRA